jgi:hypothetical protein
MKRLEPGGWAAMKKKMRTVAVIFVMTGLWIMPVSFSEAFDQPRKVSPAPVADLAAAGGESFTISPKFYSLNPCERHKFTAEVKDAKGRVLSNAEVFWVSTNPDVAFIDDAGYAIAINPGTTIIHPVIGQAHGEPASLFVRDNGSQGACYNALDKMASLDR